MKRIRINGWENGLPGQRLELTGATVYPFRGPTHPLAFDYPVYAASQGLAGQVFTDTAHPPAIADTLYRPFARLQFQALRAMAAWPLEPRYKAFLQALCLGWKGGLEQDQRELFARTGLMHVLAVSGLHMGLLYALLSGLLFFLRPVPRSAAVVLCLWGFALFTGASASVCRAAFLFSWMGLARFLRRPGQGLNGLYGAGIGLLTYRPEWAADAGFQLSFAAVWCLLRFQPSWAALLKTRPGVLKRMWDALGVSLIAQLGTTPITAWLFGKFPVYFLGPNLLLLPVVPFLMGGGLLGLAWGENPPELLLLILKMLLRVFFSVASWFSNLPGALIDLKFPLWLSALWALGFLWFGRRMESPPDVRALQALLTLGITGFAVAGTVRLQEQGRREFVAGTVNGEWVWALRYGNSLLGSNEIKEQPEWKSWMEQEGLAWVEKHGYRMSHGQLFREGEPLRLNGKRVRFTDRSNQHLPVQDSCLYLLHPELGTKEIQEFTGRLPAEARVHPIKYAGYLRMEINRPAPPGWP